MKKATLSFLLLAGLLFTNACPTTPTQTEPSASAEPYMYNPTTAPTAAPSVAPPGLAPPEQAADTGTYESVNETDINKEKLQEDNFFQDYGVNPFVDVSNDNLSTFAVDVDTASYTWMRKSLEERIFPRKDSVRTEEYINFFDYNYPQPEQGKFSINMDMAPSKFGEEGSKLLRIGIQGKEIDISERKNASLTFVIDVSGSMDMENRLGLVKRSLEILLQQLNKGDKVGIVVYGSDAKVLLEHKTIDEEAEILRAIAALTPEGSTNAEAGLRLAYKQAEKNFLTGGVNRVILCSDGVANVGRTGPESILAEIKKETEAGISLSTIGFGMGNYNDTLMEQLADNGDGNYYYVDTLEQTRRVFVENLTGTLQTIAKDAKVQVEFNPEVVKEYRLLGYENRDIADEDFRNDTVDAGEIGSNHSVTALYELKMKDGTNSGKVATVNLRYKDVDNLNTVEEINKSFNYEDGLNSFDEAGSHYKLAVAVAEYAEILKESVWAKDGTLSDVKKLLDEIMPSFSSNQDVVELVTLVNKAISLQSQKQ